MCTKSGSVLRYERISNHNIRPQAAGWRRVRPWAAQEMSLMATEVRAGTSVRRPAGLLTIDELAERLTVSVGCIRSWRLRGEGPPAIRIGSALRWDVAEVDDWLDRRRESRLESM